jgi:hypothetical protein
VPDGPGASLDGTLWDVTRFALGDLYDRFRPWTGVQEMAPRSSTGSREAPCLTRLRSVRYAANGPAGSRTRPALWSPAFSQSSCSPAAPAVADPRRRRAPRKPPPRHRLLRRPCLAQWPRRLRQPHPPQRSRGTRPGSARPDR